MAIEFLTLASLWEFLKPVAQDALKERLKPAGSPEIARARTYALYDSLQETDKRSDAFVAALRAYAEDVAGSSPPSANPPPIRLRRGDLGDRARWHELRHEAGLMVKALEALLDALREVNPQLGIHQPELVERVEQYTGTRGAVAKTLIEAGVDEALRSDAEQLRSLTATSEANRLRIKQAVAELRSFIASNFPFKDSFPTGT